MLKRKIKKLRKEGLTYIQIKEKLGYSLSTICYHLAKGQKKKVTDRKNKNNKKIHCCINYKHLKHIVKI